jgi:ubiquinone/menaquinone biosynthesis C-methylase UbiE
MRRIVPILVRPFADPNAYDYLAQSIENHVPATQLAALCGEHGAREVRVDDYSFGSATRVLAVKETPE